MSKFEIACEHCQSRYLVPDELRERLRGRQVVCAWCTRDWTPLPLDRRDPRAPAADPFAAPPFPLHAYLQTNPLAPLAPGAPPSADENVLARSQTTQQVRVERAGSAPNLRVAASGPDFELKTIYQLGDVSFLVGRRNCHLDLPLSIGLPERAIRIRAASGGFDYEGIDGFQIPVGVSWIGSGRIEADGRLELVLSPYRIALRPSSTPGMPIPDLERGPRPAIPVLAAPSAAAPAAKIDPNATMRDLSAFGADMRKAMDPLGDLDVGFVHLDPPFQGEVCWVRKSPALVGRTAGELQLRDQRVSGKHAQLDVLGLDQYSLKDLASTNGTTVNDRPASTARLKDGDVVSFGGVRLQFVARAKRRS